MIRRLMGRPVVIAAVVVGPSDSVPGVAPILVSVKFIDDGVLSRIAGQLRLNNLRKLDQDRVPVGDLAFDLNDSDGKVIGRFAWTPKQPGTEIVHNVMPFIALALIGFALLAAFVLRYMRRTAAAGVHSMQGFRFGRPVTVAEISARLQSPGAFLPIEVTALAS